MLHFVSPVSVSLSVIFIFSFSLALALFSIIVSYRLSLISYQRGFLLHSEYIRAGSDILNKADLHSASLSLELVLNLPSYLPDFF